MRSDSMGDMIPFPNRHEHKFIKKDDIILLKTMENSPIIAKLRILPQDIHVLMRVLLHERKEIQQFHKEAVDRKEIEYWRTMEDIMGSLIHKLKSIQKVEEVVQELSFIELDCFVGAVEQSLQETYLAKLQLLEDTTPIVTKTLEEIYQKALPLYEEKRKNFDSQ